MNGSNSNLLSDPESKYDLDPDPDFSLFQCLPPAPNLDNPTPYISLTPFPLSLFSRPCLSQVSTELPTTLPLPANCPSLSQVPDPAGLSIPALLHRSSVLGSWKKLGTAVLSRPTLSTASSLTSAPSTASTSSSCYLS